MSLGNRNDMRSELEEDVLSAGAARLAESLPDSPGPSSSCVEKVLRVFKTS